MSGYPHEAMPEGSVPTEISSSSSEGKRSPQAPRSESDSLEENGDTEQARESRATEFELRAQNMGITEAKFVAQKVAIWEGMWAAKQNGDDIGYGAWLLLDAATSADQ